MGRLGIFLYSLTICRVVILELYGSVFVTFLPFMTKFQEKSLEKGRAYVSSWFEDLFLMVKKP